MTGIPFKINQSGTQTKLQQLVNSITEAITNGELRAGDVLPSVNQLSLESGYSRDTVFKAYGILKQRNIVESAPTKGYFVASKTQKVFMLLDDFSAFKEQLYQSFRKNLPQSFGVDLLFHHYNKNVFKQLIESSLGRYSMYVVMNIEHNKIHPILSKIDPNKLLLLDMGRAKEGFNYILQDFNSAVINCLIQGKEQLQKYDEFLMVYSSNNTPHPQETVDAVKHFCNKYRIKCKIITEVKTRHIQKGHAFFVIRDKNLVEIVKICNQKHLKIGTDVGILSYNDTPMKQIVGGGISVVSTNFEQMGKQAAEFVKSKNKTAQILPTSLVLRESL